MFSDTPEPVVSDKFYGVWVNRVLPEKRPELPLELAQLLPDIEFHAIGSGPLTHLFEGVPNIKHTGFLTDEELSNELRHASFYVSTSRGENFGMSAVEAVAHGVPTIIPNVMGLRDYNRFICSDVAEIKNIIVRLYKAFTGKIEDELVDHGFTIMKGKLAYETYRKQLREVTLERFSDNVVIRKIASMLEDSGEIVAK